MLFCKTIHQNDLVKECFAFPCQEEQTNSTNSILVVGEKTVQLYDYFYDKKLGIPFLEPKINQNMYLHILDAKILNLKKTEKNKNEEYFINLNSLNCQFTDKNQNLVLLVLLTTCGLVIYKYDNSSGDGFFRPVVSEILNLNCEDRDKLMYLKTNDELELIVTYSNTDKVFVFKLDGENLKLKLLNEYNFTTKSYIVDLFIYPTKCEKESFRVCCLTK
jgi:hypothetical protein